MSERITFYDLLGISRSASTVEIRDAYRRAMKHHHPDVDMAPNATSIAQLVNEAWKTLRDPVARANYDAALAGRTIGITTPPVARSTVWHRARAVPWWGWAAVAIFGIVFWKYLIATAFLALLTYRTLGGRRGPF